MSTAVADETPSPSDPLETATKSFGAAGIERFEWERIVRRVRMPSSAKLLALIMATYADRDGTRIHPGIARLAAVMDVNEKTARRALAWLRDHGLIERTRQGNRHAGKADEYRLTMPTMVLDLLDTNELTPEDRSQFLEGLGVTSVR